MKNKKKVYITPSQLKVLRAKQKLKAIIAGRGWGKTTLHGDHSYNCVATMPTGKGFILGLSYNQVLTKLLPPIMQRWGELGLHEHTDKKPGHFVVGKVPPDSWDKPKQGSRYFANCVSFINGHQVELMSIDRDNNQRGGNYDWGAADEFCLIKKEKFTKVVRPMVRGHRFKNKSAFARSLLLTTSMPWLASGNWALEYEQMALDYPNDIFYMEGTAYDNIEILGQDYIDALKRELPQLVFDVEVMNKRVNKLPNAFYNELNDERHIYFDSYSYGENETGMLVTTGDADYDPNLPLEVSFDFNAKFTSCIICQEDLKNNEFRTINLFYIKFSYIRDLVNQITSYYYKHKNVIRIYGDRNGNNTFVDRGGITYYEAIRQQFRAAGFTAYVMVKGLDPLHHEKHRVLNEILSARNPKLPKMKFNGNKCQYLLLSMQSAPIKSDFTKDKSSETADIPQEKATHLSDCWDNIVYPKYANLVGGNLSGKIGRARFGK